MASLNNTMNLNQFFCVSLIAWTLLFGTSHGFSISSSSKSNEVSRRNFFPVLIAAPTAALVVPLEAAVASPKTDSMIADLKLSREKIAPIPDLLEKEDWDAVRTILKTPPVNSLWNLGETKNTLLLLAKETGNFDLIEVKDDLAGSLQMCDQFTYDNVFIYFQPGNGKVKKKEPKELAVRAMKQLDDAIALALE